VEFYDILRARGEGTLPFFPPLLVVRELGFFFPLPTLILVPNPKTIAPLFFFCLHAAVFFFPPFPLVAIHTPRVTASLGVPSSCAFFLFSSHQTCKLIPSLPQFCFSPCAPTYQQLGPLIVDLDTQPSLQGSGMDSPPRLGSFLLLIFCHCQSSFGYWPIDSQENRKISLSPIHLPLIVPSQHSFTFFIGSW